MPGQQDRHEIKKDRPKKESRLQNLRHEKETNQLKIQKNQLETKDNKVAARMDYPEQEELEDGVVLGHRLDQCIEPYRPKGVIVVNDEEELPIIKEINVKD